MEKEALLLSSQAHDTYKCAGFAKVIVTSVSCES